MYRRQIIAVAIAGALGLAACGGASGSGSSDVASLEQDGAAGSATTTTLSQAAAEAVLLEWVACMRGEGLDIADPTVDDDGNLTLGGGPGGRPGQGNETDNETQASRPDRESMQAARDVCGEPPQQVFGGEDRFDPEAMQEAALAFSECMREQGLADFPDPDFSDSGPGAGPPEDGENADGPRGPFGDYDMTSDEVQAASEACQTQSGDGGPGFPGGGPGGAPPDGGASTQADPSGGDG